MKATDSWIDRFFKLILVVVPFVLIATCLPMYPAQDRTPPFTRKVMTIRNTAAIRVYWFGTGSPHNIESDKPSSRLEIGPGESAMQEWMVIEPKHGRESYTPAATDTNRQLIWRKTLTNEELDSLGWTIDIVAGQVEPYPK